MDSSAAVLALVLAETAVGGLLLLWLLPTWGKIRHGYEILLGSTLGLMAWGGWASLRSALDSAGTVDESLATNATRLLLATAILSGLSCVALLAKVNVVGRVLGILSMLAGLASFVPIAAIRAAVPGGSGQILGVIELLLGAFLLGAIWDGMILGHWYLVERKLSNKYMIWMAWANVAAVVAGVVAVGLSAINPIPCAGLESGPAAACASTFSPLLGIGNMTIMIGVGVLSLIAVIAGFNVKLAKEGGRSIQASTGMFYLAVILAPAAEFAAKVRFF